MEIFVTISNKFDKNLFIIFKVSISIRNNLCKVILRCKDNYYITKQNIYFF